MDPTAAVAEIDVAAARGDGSLADVLPSAAAALGLPGFVNRLALPAAERICVLLVDGLGWELLREHAADAPCLTGLATAAGARGIVAGFPATTATSLASLGTGRPAGGHGIVGLSFDVADGVLLNALAWGRHGPGRGDDLRESRPPEVVQPTDTVFEQVARAGVAVGLAVPRDHVGSGLTRAVLRGGRARGVLALGDLVTTLGASLRAAPRALAYGYHGDLDLVGHVYGPGSPAWRAQLRAVDGLAGAIAEHLPADALLVVVADHGMLAADPQARVDYDDRPDLQAGVRLLGGEPRVREIYTRAGAEADVQAAWQQALGPLASVLARDDAIARGLFGDPVTAAARARIGDLVVTLHGRATVVRSRGEPMLSRLIGQHGALTAQEQLVPLLVHRAES